MVHQLADGLGFVIEGRDGRSDDRTHFGERGHGAHAGADGRGLLGLQTHQKAGAIDQMHHRQMKRLRAVVKRQRTILGVVLRELERKCKGLNQDARDKLGIWIERAQRIHEQKRQDKGKLYALHAPEVECIGKGKPHKPYEFGVKVSIAIYDQYGEPVYMYRMDGQAKIAIETAIMKARTVLNTRQPSKAVMNQVLQGRSSELRQYSFGNFANSGGLPIIINGELLGSMGVSSGDGEKCAQAAIDAVFKGQKAASN